MDFRVSPLHASSVVALAQCHIDCWRESYQGLVAKHILDAFDVDRRAQQWRRIHAEPNSAVYQALSEDVVLGFAAATEAELDALYVRRAYWGTGLADELIDAAIGDKSVRLWVFEANLRAQKFYRRHGFTQDQISRIEPFTGLTEVRMSR